MSSRNAPESLKVDWHVHGGDLTDEERGLVLERLEHLERAVREFPVSVVHVEVEHNPRKGGFGVAVNLQLPARSLYAAEWGRDLGLAGRRAMNKVIGQVATYRAMLRRHERRSQRREIRPAPAPQAPEVSVEREHEALQALRGRITRLVRHEIVHDTALVEIPKEAISVPDVVDEAMVWTLENLASRPPYLSPEQFLWRRVLHQLDLARASVLRRRAADEENDRIQATHREANPEVDMEWEDAEDLIFGGGEPMPLDLDEASRRESDPATILDREDAQKAVSDALRELPDFQRRAVLLHDLEGYDAPEIAFVLARSEDRVRQAIEDARRTLRRRLREYA